MEDSSSISFWKVAVGVLIAAILIGLIFLIARQGKSVANEKLEGVSNMLSEYQDETYALYANMDVSGSEVRNLIEKTCASDDYVSVRVQTKAGATVSYHYACSAELVLTTTGAKTYDYVKAAATTAADYINPSAVFTGAITRDKNGVLVLVSFVQK